MSYKVFGMILVLLIAGFSTAAAYEFSVSYDENMKLQSVQFPSGKPGAPAPALSSVQNLSGSAKKPSSVEPLSDKTLRELAKPPKQQKLPDGQLIMVKSLGETIYHTDENKNIACTYKIGTKTYQCPTNCSCFGDGLVFDGDGGFMGVKDLSGKIEKPEPSNSIKTDNLQGVSNVVPIGTLMIFKTKDNKIIRSLMVGDTVTTSSPSEQ